MARQPRYTLFAVSDRTPEGGDWRFAIHNDAGEVVASAADVEPHMRGERLALLTVVRGLEALDEPARVSLVTPSRYVKRGVAYGLDAWRTTDFTWELYGRMVPVKDQDLWRRLGRALELHQLMCRRWRVDAAHASPRWLRRSKAIPAGEQAAPVSAATRRATRARRQQRQPENSRWSRVVSRGWGALARGEHQESSAYAV